MLIFIDALIIPLVIWLGFWVKHENPFSEELFTSIWFIKSSLLIGIPLYLFTGQYKGLTRYVGSKSLYFLIFRNALLVIIIITLGKIFNLRLPDKVNLFHFWILVSSISGGIRFILRDLLLNIIDKNKTRISKVAIYGAGSAGAQLEASLRLAGQHSIEFFVDDNRYLWGRTLNDIPIRSYDFLSNNNSKIDQVFLAIPSLNKKNFKKITESINKLEIPLMRVPSLNELTNGNARIDTLRPILIEDILGRDIIPPDPKLLLKAISKKSVLITGAGGSIGSELTKITLRFKASKIVLLEINEPSLYKIERELVEKNPGIKIVSVLGSACNEKLVEKIIEENHIEVIFHAAAYKHVPLVERNPIVGIANNVFSTQTICEASLKHQVERVVLISSDKAVRPTNVMGASKRLSELIFQAYSKHRINIEQNQKVCFSTVRFGNVLGSSGSVVPLFRDQIAKGGPITITDKEMIRYFMTIEEASYLVLQASSLAEGGDILILDMGKPVLIKNLAKKMVQLSGLSIRDKNNHDGDIEIKYTGKRPGEKLFEELLISDESEKTSHPLIFKAKEEYIPHDILSGELKKLKNSVKNFNKNESLKILKKLVPEWNETSK